MKTITLTLTAILFMAISTFATVWTVSNNPTDIAAVNFTSLQTAIDSASVGDTLYVMGSIATYGTVDVKKQLVFIGSGYHNFNPGRPSTKVTAFNMRYMRDGLNNIISTPNGSVFTGFEANITSMDVGISNISIIRNKGAFTYYGSTTNPASNWIIMNNIINSLEHYLYQKIMSNFQILNNIVKGHCYSHSSTVKNNIFISTSCYLSGNSSTISNNIFYASSTAQLSGSTVTNNLSYSSGSTAITDFDYTSSNYDTNNVVNQDPKFVSIPVSTSPTFEYSHDYHLQSSSPAIGAGTNGTDIGIYGGSYPFPSGGPIPYQTSALPAIPQILELNISNIIIPIDSALHINIKARVRN